MSGTIFINYRRGDDPGYTQALFQQLEIEFGRGRLFMDVEGYIGAGDDFVRVLETQVAGCDVFLAVIGPRWIDARDDKGELRLHHDGDFVRIEILSALNQSKRVIPVLVNNARMPGAQELPEPLKPLAHRNGVRLSPDRFHADCRSLIKEIQEPGGRSAAIGSLMSYWMFGLTFVLLAGLSAWMAVTFGYDREVSRVLMLAFAGASLFFAFAAVVVLRRAIAGQGAKPGD